MSSLIDEIGEPAGLVIDNGSGMVKAGRQGLLEMMRQELCFLP